MRKFWSSVWAVALAAEGMVKVMEVPVELA
jgi:hypothetical protein